MRFNKVDLRKVKVGLEIEGQWKHDSVIVGLYGSPSSYHRGRYNEFGFKLEEDSSIEEDSDYDYYAELITKPFFIFRRGERGEDGLKKIIALWNEDKRHNRYDYDSSCGYHINISGIKNPVIFYLLQKELIYWDRGLPREGRYTTWWCARSKYNAFNVRNTREFIVEWRSPTPRFVGVSIHVLKRVIERGLKPFRINLSKFNKNVRKMQHLFKNSKIEGWFIMLNQTSYFEKVYNAIFTLYVARRSFKVATQGEGIKLGASKYKVALPTIQEAEERLKAFFKEVERLEFEAVYGMNEEQYKIREGLKMLFS